MNLHHTKPGWFGFSAGVLQLELSKGVYDGCTMDEGSSSPSIHESRKIHFFQVDSQQSSSFFLWPLFRWKWWVEIIHPYLPEFQVFFFCNGDWFCFSKLGCWNWRFPCFLFLHQTQEVSMIWIKTVWICFRTAGEVSGSFIPIHVGVSKNRDTPKWMVYNGKPY